MIIGFLFGKIGGSVVSIFVTWEVETRDTIIFRSSGDLVADLFLSCQFER